MPNGRPTKFKKEYIEQTKKLCKLGATDQDLADFFDVDVSTISNWKNDFPNFLEALKESKALSDNEIEESLHKRAKGYMRKIERVSRNGVVECMEEVPPDPTSMIFWLKNRCREKWRDKQEHEHSGKDGAPIAINVSVTTKNG
jgi:hypothetical protein